MMTTDFDETIGIISTIPQDIDRVILNLITEFIVIFSFILTECLFS